MQQHRQAVMMLARRAAKRAVQDELRAQGVCVSLVTPAEIMRQAREYLDAHPELYKRALERAKRMGYADPRSANIKSCSHKTAPLKQGECSLALHNLTSLVMKCGPDCDVLVPASLALHHNRTSGPCPTMATAKNHSRSDYPPA